MYTRMYNKKQLHYYQMFSWTNFFKSSNSFNTVSSSIFFAPAMLQLMLLSCPLGALVLTPSFPPATAIHWAAENLVDTSSWGTTALPFNSPFIFVRMRQGFSLGTIFTAFDKENFSEPGNVKKWQKYGLFSCSAIAPFI